MLKKSGLFGQFRFFSYLCIVKQLKIQIMARKYSFYQLAKEHGVNNYEDYRNAFSAYQRTNGSATLYGVDEYDSFTCIMSK